MGAILAAELIGVRGAKLALHLPEQVRKLATRGHALYQRGIARIDRLPGHPAHISHPELLALQAPRLAQHLAPFSAGAQRDLDALQIKPARFAARLLSGGRGQFRRLLACLEDAQPLIADIQQRLAISGHAEIGDLPGDLLLLALLEVIELQAAVRLRPGFERAAVAQTLDGELGKERALAYAKHPAIAPLRDGEGDDAVG